jgi:PIN domain nuclease of toxin-antitoxin system
VRLLLDTAVVIYAVESPGQLSRRATSVLRNPRNSLELSSISLAEIAIKASVGKLRLPAMTARQAIQDLDLHILPFSGEHAFELYQLPLHHGDPFDRQIIAQALCEEIPVVTPDETFGLYQGLKILW